MRILRSTLLVAFLFLAAGCASIMHGPDRPPTAQELVGVYDWGHRGSAETVRLHADGTFSRTLHGHLGQDSVTFAGAWFFEDELLVMQESPRERGTPERIDAEAFFFKRKPAFARLSDIKDEKVHDWWVYRRRDGD